MSDSFSIQEKRTKFLETFLTIGGFLGIIFALQPNNANSVLKDWFILGIVLFMVSALLTYRNLLFSEWKTKFGWWFHWISVMTMALSFTSILWILIADPLSEVLFNQPYRFSSDNWYLVLLLILLFPFIMTPVRDAILLNIPRPK
jgi:hypothetical protein